MIAERQRDSVEGYFRAGVAEGAKIVTGGGPPVALNRGWFLEPTVMTHVDNRSTVAQDEVFGPLLTVTTFRDASDAIRLANGVALWPGRSVYTIDSDLARSVVSAVRTGTISVNGAATNYGAPMGA